MMTTEMQDKMPSDQRRSQRIFLSVGITVHGTGASGQPISEEARTLVVNAHGALLPLESPVVLGQVLTVRHNKTEEELFCRVARIDRSDAGRTEIGIEFLQPSPRFWRVTFPPEDWKPAEPEAAQAIAPLCVRAIAPPRVHAIVGQAA
jgi:hypothetical protein